VSLLAGNNHTWCDLLIWWTCCRSLRIAVVSVDAQAIAYDEPEDNLYTDFAQSIAYTRDFGAPKPAISKVRILSVPSKDVLKAVADAHPSSRPEMILRKARKEQYKIDREEYYEKAGRVNPALRLDDTSSEDQLDTETTEKPEKELTVGRWR
jgi:hypothetical protein